ncbi:ABC transporter ATP-binding protein [Pseudoalteromonas aurantia]|uniref:ATP-binding cassette, subfamily C, bacterial n=1 Tax=Pseudoalteromonas aurantia 208 TaxID=1314867 RepID=A0ABR9E9V8_9GAMM|nr:ABC transporter ATP-binding protein [Pseudoalteromonas aurantia]MBE0366558.1 ATP-binding cassette, subfamily C, bacterial [Pseudoalteromonas aurantia 208]
MTKSLSWQDIRQQVIAHKKPLFTAHIIAFLAALVSVPIPLMMPLLVDEVLLGHPGAAIAFLNQFLPAQWHQPTAYILVVLLGVVLMRLGALILGVFQSRQFTFIGKDISLKIREQLLDHLPQVQLKEYETQGAGAISSRCITDVETLDTFISQTLSRFLIGLLTIIGTAAVLLWIDFTLGLTILLLNPAVIYFSRQFGKRIKHLKKDENAAFEAFQSSLVETLDAISQLKAVRREGAYFSHVRESAADLKHFAIQSQWKTDAVSRLSFTVFLLGFEVFRAIAMLMVVFADLTVGQIFAVFGYLWFMMGPVQELLGIQYAYYGASAALQRLNQVFAFATERAAPAKQSRVFEQQEVGIHFSNVDFGYNEEQPVLQNVTLDIPAGKKVAVVAVSGGGKSTLVQLLLGLYEKQSGQIYIADTAIEDVGYHTVRENIATVLQQPILFNATVRENLTMGREHTEQEMWQALKVSELDDTIRVLDNGLDARVGRNGVRLSGGQKQRLAIARMVLANPKVVILDEATSALDIETESKVHRNLQDFLSNRTTLIIAHRLSAIRQADLIYVLDDGRVSQSGSHEALSAEQGLYKTLFGRQIG